MKAKSSHVSIVFLQMCLIFIVALISSNLFETKQIAIGPLEITGGMITFPICYIVCVLVCEVWGYQKAALLIWAGFLKNFIFEVTGALVDALPGADYWTNDEGFHAIFGMSERITLASFIAFLCGSFTNAYVQSRLKVKYEGKQLAKRLALSFIAGEAVDAVIFFPVAFLGVLTGAELLRPLLFQFVLITAIEIAFIPLTIIIIRNIKKIEEVDTYDNDNNYDVFAVFKHSKNE